MSARGAEIACVQYNGCSPTGREITAYFTFGGLGMMHNHFSSGNLPAIFNVVDDGPTLIFIWKNTFVSRANSIQV
jgi:hypothetical protein